MLVVPAATPAAEALAWRPDGVMLSNGPGDPATVGHGVQATRELLGRVPLFGICLGHQLLGQAVGGRTVRLKFGHRGVNQPVVELATGRVAVTSHNHGFAVDGDSLPAGVAVTHANANDGVVEGLECLDAPAFSVQYHPEAAPAPMTPTRCSSGSPTSCKERDMTEQRTFRALGGVDQGALPPAGEVADALRAEFERVFTLKASLRGEAEAGVSPTGRRTTAQDEAKLRTLVASVEGASRFAIRLRLLNPAQVRALWAEAMANGLYDGWDAGQSAYGHGGDA